MTYKGHLALVKVRQAIAAGVKRASYRSTIKARRYAEGVTSGPWRQDDLNRMDNPYAARHGAILGSVHPFWINKQKGTLENSWRITTVNQIINTDPIASYVVKGTRHLIGRDIITPIKKEWARLREDEIMREMALIGLPCRKT